MGILNSFTFAGSSSLNKGLIIERKSSLNGAEADVEEYEVPGRDGTVFRSSGRRRNVEISYETFLKVPEDMDLPRYTGDLKRWLLSSPGEYRRLEDTYDPDHFHMAVYAGGLEFENEVPRFTRQTAAFNCLPYRYRKSGETELDITSGGVLVNDTGFDALPLLRIKLIKGNLPPETSIQVTYEDGSAYLQELGNLIETQSAAVLDCENQLIFGSNGELVPYNDIASFPVLKPGENHITVSGQRVSKVTVVPRWREL